MLNDRYELTDRLGAGGTGEVFRARDHRLDREVAVKLLRSDSTDESARARMEAEARLAGGLVHPCIARVLDYDVSDEDEARPFIVMEHVEGVALSRLLREEGALSPERTMRIVADVASALHVAHEAGVVHRDVKPGNIIVDPDGRAVLVDFGIARSPTSEPLTSTGSILGTADYLSPEQATGRQASARSDLYSLGIVAFACLAGKPPFPRENDVATALAHVSEPLPPLEDVPSPVVSLVRRMTAKDPLDRPVSAAEVEAEAAALAAEQGSWSPVPQEPATGRLLTAVAAAHPERRSSRRARLVVLPAAGLVAAAAVVLALLPGTPTVPSVVGMQVDDAAAMLADAGIDVERDLVDEPGEDAGIVLAQTPGAGAEDDLVTLEVASGKVRLARDDVVGRRVEKATAALTKLGLVVKVTREPSTEKDGTVTAIDRSGRLEVGSTVELTVATAPAQPVAVSPPTTGSSGARDGGGTSKATSGKAAKGKAAKGKAKGKGRGKGR